MGVSKQAVFVASMAFLALSSTITTFADGQAIANTTSANYQQGLIAQSPKNTLKIGRCIIEV